MQPHGPMFLCIFLMLGEDGILTKNGNLNKRQLRIVLDEKSLHYQELLSKFNSSDLYSIKCQDMMKTVFKTIQFETMLKYI